MTKNTILAVDGPFSLAAAAGFGLGPNTGRPFPEGEVMRLAFVPDDLRHHVGAAISQRPDGSLVVELSGDGEPTDQAITWLRRIKGFGPVYTMLVYLRATGVTDALTLGEPRLASYLRHYSTCRTRPIPKRSRGWRSRGGHSVPGRPCSSGSRSTAKSCRSTSRPGRSEGRDGVAAARRQRWSRRDPERPTGPLGSPPRGQQS